jgi:hypothetical protein
MRNEHKPGSLALDGGAVELAEWMMGREAVKRDVLEETIYTAEHGEPYESGRVACPASGGVRGPTDRFPTQVKLRGCPVGGGGVWHTHITRSQLRTPTNSIPDIAAVVFGECDVMGVVGTRSEEYFVASEDREAMKREFQNVTGVEAESTTDFVRALDHARLAVTDTHDRLRRVFADNFITTDSHWPHLDRRVTAAPVTRGDLSGVAYEKAELEVYAPLSDTDATQTVRVRERARRCNDGLDSLLEAVPSPNSDGFGGVVMGAMVGAFVSNVVERVLFE